MTEASRPMSGRTVLVTGATSGIGLETARSLGAMGALVIVGARDPARGRAVADGIVAAGGRAETLVLDFASLESVRRAARELSTRHARLDVLVNNAGTAIARRETTADGHDRPRIRLVQFFGPAASAAVLNAANGHAEATPEDSP